MTRLASWADYGTHDESAYPELWRGCVFAAAMCLGPTGLRLHDLSRYRNWGTLTGMDLATDWVVSGGRYALDFDGLDDFSQTDAPRATSTQQGVISAWALCRSVPIEAGVFAGVFENSGLNSQIYLGVLNDASVLRGLMVIRTGNVTHLVGTTEAISLNTWNHMAISGGPNSSRFFLNGREVSLTASVGALTTVWTSTLTNDFLMIGARRLSGAPSLFFDGQLDDVRIYNRNLSHAEHRLLATRRGIAYERRKRKQVYFDAAFFNPAWARNSNVILSPVGAA